MKIVHALLLSTLLATPVAAESRFYAPSDLLALDVASVRIDVDVEEVRATLEAAGYVDAGYQPIEKDQARFWGNEETGQYVGVVQYYDSLDKIFRVQRIVFQQDFNEPQPLDRTRAGIVARYGEPSVSLEKAVVYHPDFQIDHAYVAACRERIGGCLNKYGDATERLGLTYQDVDRLYGEERRMPQMTARFNERTVQIDLNWSGASDAASERANAALVVEQERLAQEERDALATSQPVKLGF